MTKKKRQHYVPRFYLSQFTEKTEQQDHEDSLWVFEKSTGRIFRKAPQNIGFSSYFYSLKTEKELSNVIEDALAKMESDFSPVYHRILNGQTELSNVKERYWVARFICFLNYRTLKSDQVFDMLGQNVFKEKYAEQVNQEGGPETYIKNRNWESSPERFLESFNKMKILPPKEMKLKIMVHGALNMITSLSERKWSFLKPKSSAIQFITSDHPVVLFNPKHSSESFVPGHRLKDTDIIFPMSPGMCFYASHDDANGVNVVSDQAVVSINRNVARFSHKYVFSNTNNFMKNMRPTMPK